MVIDFHTHIFPDNLAEKAMASLCEGVNYELTPIHNGTLKGLLQSMDNAKIDVSVNLPVVTKVSQTKAACEFSASVASDRIISFGGIHPQTDDYKRDIDFVVSLGLKGLKFHSEYQDFNVDDPYMLKIYDYALSKGLIVLHHAGKDQAYPNQCNSTPKQFANVAKAMSGGVIVAAHFGGHQLWDEVENELAGTNIYFDTSMGFEYFSKEQFLRIVKKHGADKILFATDSPWSNSKYELETLLSLPLEKNEIEAIAGGNAKRLLGIK